jgi:DNA-directed RNA polymerase alpha subunit/DNA-binding PadR family transcriptional regulator
MRNKVLLRITSLIVLILFLANDICYGLGTAPMSQTPDGPERAFALGQKLFGTKLGPSKIDFDEYKPGTFQGYVSLIDQNDYIPADYEGIISGEKIPSGWSNNPILRDPKFLKYEGLVEAFRYFAINEAHISEDQLEVEEGIFDLKHEDDGEYGIACTEKHILSDGRVKYKIIIHSNYVKEWNKIRKHDVWRRCKTANGTDRIFSTAWALFFRVAKHEMTDLVNAELKPKGGARSHLTYSKDSRLIEEYGWDADYIEDAEYSANTIAGNYRYVNDAVWLWFLGSYAYNNATRYDNDNLKARLNWFFNTDEQDRLGLKLHREFPNLLKDASEREKAIQLALAINYDYFGRPLREKGEVIEVVGGPTQVQKNIKELATIMAKQIVDTAAFEKQSPWWATTLIADHIRKKVDEYVERTIAFYILSKGRWPAPEELKCVMIWYKAHEYTTENEYTKLSTALEEELSSFAIKIVKDTSDPAWRERLLGLQTMGDMAIDYKVLRSFIDPCTIISKSFGHPDSGFINDGTDREFVKEITNAADYIKRQKTLVGPMYSTGGGASEAEKPIPDDFKAADILRRQIEKYFQMSAQVLARQAEILLNEDARRDFDNKSMKEKITLLLMGMKIVGPGDIINLIGKDNTIIPNVIYRRITIAPRKKATSMKFEPEYAIVYTLPTEEGQEHNYFLGDLLCYQVENKAEQVAAEGAARAEAPAAAASKTVDATAAALEKMAGGPKAQTMTKKPAEENAPLALTKDGDLRKGRGYMGDIERALAEMAPKPVKKPAPKTGGRTEKGKSPEDAMTVIALSYICDMQNFTIESYISAYNDVRKRFPELGFKKLSENTSTVRRDLYYRNIRSLVDRGMIEKFKDGGHLVFALTQLGREEVNRRREVNDALLEAYAVLYHSTKERIYWNLIRRRFESDLAAEQKIDSIIAAGSMIKKRLSGEDLRALRANVRKMRDDEMRNFPESPVSRNAQGRFSGRHGETRKAVREHFIPIDHPVTIEKALDMMRATGAIVNEGGQEFMISALRDVPLDNELIEIIVDELRGKGLLLEGKPAAASPRRTDPRSIEMDDLGLSERSLEVVVLGGVASVEQLTNKTRNELLSIISLGNVRLKHIEDRLTLNGLKLRKDSVPPAPVAPLKRTDPRSLELKDLSLTVRSLGGITQGDITSVEQLITKTGYELLSIRGLGQTALNNIKVRLALKGLYLKGDPNTPTPAAVEPKAAKSGAQPKITESEIKTYHLLSDRPGLFRGVLLQAIKNHRDDPIMLKKTAFEIATILISDERSCEYFCKTNILKDYLLRDIHHFKDYKVAMSVLGTAFYLASQYRHEYREFVNDLARYYSAWNDFQRNMIRLAGFFRDEKLAPALIAEFEKGIKDYRRPWRIDLQFAILDALQAINYADESIRGMVIEKLSTLMTDPENNGCISDVVRTRAEEVTQDLRRGGSKEEIMQRYEMLKKEYSEYLGDFSKQKKVVLEIVEDARKGMPIDDLGLCNSGDIAKYFGIKEGRDPIDVAGSCNERWYPDQKEYEGFKRRLMGGLRRVRINYDESIRNMIGGGEAAKAVTPVKGWPAAIRALQNAYFYPSSNIKEVTGPYRPQTIKDLGVSIPEALFKIVKALRTEKKNLINPVTPEEIISFLKNSSAKNTTLAWDGPDGISDHAANCDAARDDIQYLNVRCKTVREAIKHLTENAQDFEWPGSAVYKMIMATLNRYFDKPLTRMSTVFKVMERARSNDGRVTLPLAARKRQGPPRMRILTAQNTGRLPAQSRLPSIFKKMRGILISNRLYKEKDPGLLGTRGNKNTCDLKNGSLIFRNGDRGARVVFSSNSISIHQRLREIYMGVDDDAWSCEGADLLVDIIVDRRHIDSYPSQYVCAIVKPEFLQAYKKRYGISSIDSIRFVSQDDTDEVRALRANRLEKKGIARSVRAKPGNAQSSANLATKATEAAQKADATEQAERAARDIFVPIGNKVTIEEALERMRAAGAIRDIGGRLYMVSPTEIVLLDENLIAVIRSALKEKGLLEKSRPDRAVGILGALLIQAKLIQFEPLPTLGPKAWAVQRLGIIAEELPAVLGEARAQVVGRWLKYSKNKMIIEAAKENGALLAREMIERSRLLSPSEKVIIKLAFPVEAARSNDRVTLPLAARKRQGPQRSKKLQTTPAEGDKTPGVTVFAFRDIEKFAPDSPFVRLLKAQGKITNAFPLTITVDGIMCYEDDPAKAKPYNVGIEDNESTGPHLIVDGYSQGYLINFDRAEWSRVFASVYNGMPERNTEKIIADLHTELTHALKIAEKELGNGEEPNIQIQCLKAQIDILEPLQGRMDLSVDEVLALREQMKKSKVEDEGLRDVVFSARPIDFSSDKDLYVGAADDAKRRFETDLKAWEKDLERANNKVEVASARITITKILLDKMIGPAAAVPEALKRKAARAPEAAKSAKVEPRFKSDDDGGRGSAERNRSGRAAAKMNPAGRDSGATSHRRGSSEISQEPPSAAGRHAKLADLATHPLINALIAMILEYSKTKAGLIDPEKFVLPEHKNNQTIYWLGGQYGSNNASFADILDKLARDRVKVVNEEDDSVTIEECRTAITEELVIRAGLEGKIRVDAEFVKRFEKRLSFQVGHFGIEQGAGIYVMNKYKPFRNRILHHERLERAVHRQLIKTTFQGNINAYRIWRKESTSTVTIRRISVRYNNALIILRSELMNYANFAQTSHDIAERYAPVSGIFNTPRPYLMRETETELPVAAIAGNDNAGSAAAKPEVISDLPDVTPIQDCKGISVLTQNALLRADITTVGELVKRAKRELLRIQDLGVKGVAEIVQFLESCKRRLATDEERAATIIVDLRDDIDKLGISKSICSILNSAGIYNVWELVKLSKEDMRLVKVIGPVRITEIEGRLAFFGLRFGMNEDEAAAALARNNAQRAATAAAKAPRVEEDSADDLAHAIAFRALAEYGRNEFNSYGGWVAIGMLGEIIKTTSDDAARAMAYSRLADYPQSEYVPQGGMRAIDQLSIIAKESQSDLAKAIANIRLVSFYTFGHSGKDSDSIDRLKIIADISTDDAAKAVSCGELIRYYASGTNGAAYNKYFNMLRVIREHSKDDLAIAHASVSLGDTQYLHGVVSRRISVSIRARAIACDYFRRNGNFGYAHAQDASIIGLERIAEQRSKMAPVPARKSAGKAADIAKGDTHPSSAGLMRGAKLGDAVPHVLLNSIIKMAMQGLKKGQNEFITHDLLDENLWWFGNEENNTSFRGIFDELVRVRALSHTETTSILENQIAVAKDLLELSGLVLADGWTLDQKFIDCFRNQLGLQVDHIGIGEGRRYVMKAYQEGAGRDTVLKHTEIELAMHRAFMAKFLPGDKDGLSIAKYKKWRNSVWLISTDLVDKSVNNFVIGQYGDIILSVPANRRLSYNAFAQIAHDLAEKHAAVADIYKGDATLDEGMMSPYCSAKGEFLHFPTAGVGAVLYPTLIVAAAEAIVANEVSRQGAIHKLINLVNNAGETAVRNALEELETLFAEDKGKILALGGGNPQGLLSDSAIHPIRDVFNRRLKVWDKIPRNIDPTKHSWDKYKDRKQSVKGVKKTKILEIYARYRGISAQAINSSAGKFRVYKLRRENAYVIFEFSKPFSRANAKQKPVGGCYIIFNGVDAEKREFVEGPAPRVPVVAGSSYNAGPRVHAEFGSSPNDADDQFIKAKKCLMVQDVVEAQNHVRKAIRLLREVGFDEMVSGYPVADMVNEVAVAIEVLRELLEGKGDNINSFDNEMIMVLTSLEHNVNGEALKELLWYTAEGRVLATVRPELIPAAIAILQDQGVTACNPTVTKIKDDGSEIEMRIDKPGYNSGKSLTFGISMIDGGMSPLCEVKTRYSATGNKPVEYTDSSIAIGESYDCAFVRLQLAKGVVRDWDVWVKVGAEERATIRKQMASAKVPAIAFAQDVRLPVSAPAVRAASAEHLMMLARIAARKQWSLDLRLGAGSVAGQENEPDLSADIQGIEDEFARYLARIDSVDILRRALRLLEKSGNEIAKKRYYAPFIQQINSRIDRLARQIPAAVARVFISDPAIATLSGMLDAGDFSPGVTGAIMSALNGEPSGIERLSEILRTNYLKGKQSAAIALAMPAILKIAQAKPEKSRMRHNVTAYAEGAKVSNGVVLSPLDARVTKALMKITVRASRTLSDSVGDTLVTIFDINGIRLPEGCRLYQIRSELNKGTVIATTFELKNAERPRGVVSGVMFRSVTSVSAAAAAREEQRGPSEVEPGMKDGEDGEPKFEVEEAEEENTPGEAEILKTHAQNENALKNNPLVEVISEYIVKLGSHDGPGAVKPVSAEELEAVYKSLAKLNNRQMEIFWSKRKGHGLTETMLDIIRDIGNRRGQKQSNVACRQYENLAGLSGMLENDSGALKVIVTDIPSGEDGIEERLELVRIIAANPERFKNVRFINMEMPDEFEGASTKERSDSKTVFQADAIMRAILARLYESNNRTPFVESLLRTMLEGTINCTVDEFLKSLAEAGDVTGLDLSDDKDKATFIQRISLAVDHAVKMVENIGQRIRLDKAFWVAA